MDRVIAIVAIFVAAGGCSSPCSSTERTLLRDTSGLVFSTVDTSCDLIGKDRAISIYVTDGSARSLLIKYDPDERSGGSRISVDGNKINISLDSVSSLFSESGSFRSYKVEYQVRHVEYSGK